MSYQKASQPECERTFGLIQLLIRPKEKDLGEFTVRRVLPAPQRRMVGPFIFFDHMGPAEFPPGQGIQVRPHPHIGIATITYLFEGEIMHRDSLGFEQPIRPGAVNLMTAGRGIVHSERAGSDLDEHSRLHGIQSWMALPNGQEENEPAFEHTPAADLPEITQGGVTIRIIIGEAFGHTSPVTSHLPMLYLHCAALEDTELTLPDDYDEQAFYVVSGKVRVGDVDVTDGTMIVVRPDTSATIRITRGSQVMVIGGEAPGERHIWWNFVSSSKERIEQASQEWSQGGFERIDGDDEFIPLPG